MFLVVAYDVPSDRTEKYRKVLARFLSGVQRSVFLGDLTDVQYRALHRLLKELHLAVDHIVIVIIVNRRNARVVNWEDDGERVTDDHLGSGVL